MADRDTYQRGAFMAASRLGDLHREMERWPDELALAETVASRTSVNAGEALRAAAEHLEAFRKEMAKAYVNLIEASRG